MKQGPLLSHFIDEEMRKQEVNNQRSHTTILIQDVHLKSHIKVNLLP